jgi:hypothetical protein
MNKMSYLDRAENQNAGGNFRDSNGELAGTGTPSDHGRGRRAVAPWQIPWKGWKDISDQDL